MKGDINDIEELAELLKDLGNRISKFQDQTIKKLKYELDENAKKATDKVVLDVGGKRFVTTRATLLSRTETYFSALLLSGKYKEPDGSYFIDRSPVYFKFIMEFMRTGKVQIEHLSSEQRSALATEFKYYEVKGKDVDELMVNKEIKEEQKEIKEIKEEKEAKKEIKEKKEEKMEEFYFSEEEDLAFGLFD